MKVNILIPNSKEAFGMLTSNIAMLDWFEQNNRPYQMEFYNNLNNPIINNMIADRNLLTNGDYKAFDDKHFITFSTDLYPNCNYQPIADKLLEFVATIEKVFPKFESLNKSWGFKLFDNYNIGIDYFGRGGKYNSNTGLVKLGALGGKTLPTDKSVITIIHEMIHLGIEENIIQKYNLPQEEKERIVDNLCIYVMEGIVEAKRFKNKNGELTPYQNVAECASYMDKIVGIQPDNNLDKAVFDFVNSKKIKRYHLNNSR